MTGWAKRIRAFLTAEEVPRWFGLSIVLIYLAGLGTVSRIGIVIARREASGYFLRSSDYAIETLRHRLAVLAEADLSSDRRALAYRLALREFAEHVPALQLRIVDSDRTIVASIHPAEVGTTAPPLSDMSEGTSSAVLSDVGRGRGGQAFRHEVRLTGPFVEAIGAWCGASAPRAEGVADQSTTNAIVWTDESSVATAAMTPSQSSDAVPIPAPPDAKSVAEPREPGLAATLFLEGELAPEQRTAISIADQISLFTMVCVVLGALFVVYRGLREQLRGVHWIAERLEVHRGRLMDAPDALRFPDDGSNETIAAWNELVTLLHDALERLKRNEADAELCRVLARGRSGALADALHVIPDGLLHLADENRIEYGNASACRLIGAEVKTIRGVTLTDAATSELGRRLLKIVNDSLKADGTFGPSTAWLNAAMEDATSTTLAVEPLGSSENDRSAPPVALPTTHDGEATTPTVGPPPRPAPSATRPRRANPPPTQGATFRVWVLPLAKAGRENECVVVIRDVTQQVRADKAREDLIGQVTHELRTPLTNIRAYAETLSSGMFEDPKVVTECYNVINKETRRLSRLIEDMLNVSQLEVGDIELTWDQVDLRPLLSDGVRDVRGLADEKNIDLQLTLPAKLEPIRGDRDKLAVVINNLLGNAIKYTPAGGNVLVGCTVATRGIKPAQSGAAADSFGSEVVITVKDNGIGIDEADRQKVFEKFYRAASKEVQTEAGTGLGLYTAREIVRRHGGEIELLSTLGEGSTFLVRLPIAESRAAGLSQRTEIAKGE